MCLPENCLCDTHTADRAAALSPRVDFAQLRRTADNHVPVAVASSHRSAAGCRSYLGKLLSADRPGVKPVFHANMLQGRTEQPAGPLDS